MADTPVIKTEPNTTQPHSDKTPTNGVKPISPEQEELIHRLVYFQNEYEQPSDEDLKRISVSRNFFRLILEGGEKGFIYLKFFSGAKFLCG